MCPFMRAYMRANTHVCLSVRPFDRPTVCVCVRVCVRACVRAYVCMLDWLPSSNLIMHTQKYFSLISQSNDG